MAKFYSVITRSTWGGNGEWYYKSKTKARQKYNKEVKELKKIHGYREGDSDWRVGENYIWHYNVGYEAGDEIRGSVTFNECKFEDEEV